MLFQFILQTRVHERSNDGFDFLSHISYRRKACLPVGSNNGGNNGEFFVEATCAMWSNWGNLENGIDEECERICGYVRK